MRRAGYRRRAEFALRAGADDTSARPGPWTYRPGQTYEYEAKTEFEYSNGSYEATYKNPCGGPDLKHTVEKLTHQSETVQLKATVTAVSVRSEVMVVHHMTEPP